MKQALKTLLVVIAVAFVAAGCATNPEFFEVPAGYVGKVLTSTGWQDKIYEAGQVDLRTTARFGEQNVLVLLEVTSVTVKEQFLGPEANQDKQDHRAVTKNGTSLTADVYMRLIPPKDKAQRDSIFLQITPENTPNSRVKVIKLESIYKRMAQMDVRSGARLVLAQYEDYKAVVNSLNQIADKTGVMVIEIFKRNGVPLQVQNVSASNMKPDENVMKAEIERTLAETRKNNINLIGAALRANPEYLEYMQWETAKIGFESPKGASTIVIAGSGGRISPEALAAAAALQKK